MNYSFDSHGWFSEVEIPGRTTDVAPQITSGSPVVGQPWPNFIGPEQGWTMVPYVAPVILAPVVPPNQWPGIDYLRRFTQAERISARTLANTDPYAYDFWHLLDSAIASGTPIYANDPDVVAGMAYLSANPASGPVLAAGRSAAILAA